MDEKDKVYRYKGKIYCETDLSETDENYGGDLWTLFRELQKDDKAVEVTYYYRDDDGEISDSYDSEEDVIEHEFADLCVGDEDNYDKD